MSKRILILTGDGGESYETLYALHRFQEEGWTAEIAAPSKRRLHLVLHDFEPGWDTYIERQPGYGASAHLRIADVKWKKYDAVLLIGGRAPEYLRNDPKVLKIVIEMAAAGKFIFSICHGIQILAAAGLVKDREVTCYINCRNEVDTAGGKFNGKPQALRDGKIVTGQTWESHPEFYRLAVAALKEG
jgi:protease I